MTKDNDRYSEDWADNIRGMMQSAGLPYLRVGIDNINSDYADAQTPLTVLAAKMESLVNILLWDVYTSDMMSAGLLLHQFEDQIENLMALGSYLRLRHDGGAGTTPKRPRQQRKEEPPEPPEPIPKIFSEILKDILTDLNEQSDAKKKPSKTRKDKKMQKDQNENNK